MPSRILHSGVVSFHVVMMLKQSTEKPLEEELRDPDGNQSHVRADSRAPPSVQIVTETCLTSFLQRHETPQAITRQLTTSEFL